MKILVTGATGFIGYHLTCRLLKDKSDVHVITRQQSKIQRLNNVKEALHVHNHDGSIENMCDIMKKVKPDIIYHLATAFIVDHKREDVKSLIESNVSFPIQVLEAMRVNGLSKIITVGTYWQHYNNEEYNPVNLYAASKQAFEVFLKYYTEACGMKAIILKLFHTYGPCDVRKKLFQALRAASDGGEVIHMTDGAQLLIYVYVDDVIEAFLIAADRLISGPSFSFEKYSVASGVNYSLREIVEKYELALKKKVKVDWVSEPSRKREIKFPYLKDPLLPLWKEKFDLSSGIRSMEKIDCGKEYSL